MAYHIKEQPVEIKLKDQIEIKLDDLLLENINDVSFKNISISVNYPV